MSFFFGFWYFVSAMTTLQLEMLLIWSYINRKSDLLTTAIDLLNRDTVIAHNMQVSIVYILTRTICGKNLSTISRYDM